MWRLYKKNKPPHTFATMAGATPIYFGLPLLGASFFAAYRVRLTFCPPFALFLLTVITILLLGASVNKEK